LGDSYSEGEDVLADSSSNVNVTGYTYGDFDGNKNLCFKDIIIVKYDSSGTKQWTKQFGTSSDFIFDYLMSINWPEACVNSSKILTIKYWLRIFTK